jgi:hypothetical protein
LSVRRRRLAFSRSEKVKGPAAPAEAKAMHGEAALQKAALRAAAGL